MTSFKNFEGKIISKKDQRKIQGGRVCGFGKCVHHGDDGVWEYTYLGDTFVSILDQPSYYYDLKL